MRIGIYGRKSKWTGRGESVENQILLCRDYIEKYIEGSRNAEILVYKDEGFSGKDTKRPQFQKMLSDMKQRPFQYLVCYRLDRLGRNLGDLTRLIEKLNQEHTEFISIRERFDTSTPMGKAMVYFSGVLAQMEREQIGERVRDNMLLLARSGRWLGGNPPLGFRVREKTYGEGKERRAFYLENEEKESHYLIEIFQEYLISHSLTGTARKLQEKGIFTKRGNPYTPESVREILENPVYCQSGELAYEYFSAMGCQMGFQKEEAREDRGLIRYGKRTSAVYRGQEAPAGEWIIAQGEHRGLISQEDFLEVQRILKKHCLGKRGEGRIQNPVCLLSGLLFCSCGSKMRPKYYSRNQATDTGERKFSYRCPWRDRTRGQDCQEGPLLGNPADRQLWSLLMEKTRKEISLEEVFREIRKRVEKERDQEEGEFQEEKGRLEREARRLAERLAKTEDQSTAEFLLGEIQKRIKEKEALEERRTKEKNVFTQEERERLVLRCLEPEFLESFLSPANKRDYIRLFIRRIVWEEGRLKVY